MGGFAVPDDLQIRDGAELFHGVGFDLCHVPQLVLQMIASQLHGFGKSGDLGGGLRAGAQPHLLPAAGQQGAGIPHPRADVQCTDALGRADLVAGEGDEVRPSVLAEKGIFRKPCTASVWSSVLSLTAFSPLAMSAMG